MPWAATVEDCRCPDTRQAAPKAFDPAHRLSAAWWWAAKYHAVALRQWVGVYRDRAGYDLTWQRRYRRSR